jgi:hypothetical protein
LNKCPIGIHENRTQKPDFFDGVAHGAYVDSITNVERMLYEKEDDAGEHLLET